jgi:hypothetical protein
VKLGQAVNRLFQQFGPLMWDAVSGRVKARLCYPEIGGKIDGHPALVIDGSHRGLSGSVGQGHETRLKVPVEQILRVQEEMRGGLRIEVLESFAGLGMGSGGDQFGAGMAFEQAYQLPSAVTRRSQDRNSNLFHHFQ